MTQRRVAVLGAGSWGTALANLLAHAGHTVSIWALEPEVVEEMRGGENRRYLPDVPLHPALTASGDPAEVLGEAEFIVSAVPAQFVGGVLEGVRDRVPDDALIVSASKGIEIHSLRTMDQLFLDVLGPGVGPRFTALSGPSFAAEVATGSPTAVVVAARSQDARESVQRLFQTDVFRVYTSSDLVGVELSGALKNVVAVAAGVVDGLGFGHNTLAALITRGLAEIMRLGVAMGANPVTFSGLAGMGDLVLTCTGGLSRNRTVGYRLGQGESLDEILAGMTAVAEGVRTAEAVRELAGRYEVEMPIADEVYRVLFENRRPVDAVRALMLRDPKAEHE